MMIIIFILFVIIMGPECRSMNYFIFIIGYLLSRGAQVITSVFFIISFGGLFDAVFGKGEWREPTFC